MDITILTIFSKCIYKDMALLYWLMGSPDVLIENEIEKIVY